MSFDRAHDTAGPRRVLDQAGRTLRLHLDPPERRESPGPAGDDSRLAALTALLAPALGDPATAALLLLDRFGGSLAAVLAAPEERLAAAPEMTPAAAALLAAARRAASLALEERFAREVIASWTALEAWARLNMGALPTERTVALFLDRKNGLIRHEELGRGTVDHTPLYPREVVKRALELDASAVILLHNHPSGNPTPSSQDVDMTRQLADALAAIGVVLHDHAVVGRERVLSMRTEGLI